MEPSVSGLKQITKESFYEELDNEQCLFFPDSGLFLGWNDDEEKDEDDEDEAELFIAVDSGGTFLDPIAGLTDNEVMVLMDFLNKRLQYKVN